MTVKIPRLFCCLILISYLPFANAQEIEWVVSDATLKPEFSRLNGTEKEIRLYAARNEYEPVQIQVLTPFNARLFVEVSDLKNGENTIKAKYCDVSQVLFLNIENPKRAFFKPGQYPDPVVPVTRAAPLVTKAGKVTPIWLTWFIPPTTAPGDYSGAIKVTGDNCNFKVPISLHVWNFRLPKISDLATSANLVNPHIYKVENSDIYNYERWGEPQEVVERYYKNLIDHRITEYTHGPVLPDLLIYAENGNVRIEKEGFEKSMEHMMSLGFKKVRFPGVRFIRYTDGTHDMPADVKWKFEDCMIPVFKDSKNTIFTEEFKSIFTEAYNRVVRYLEEKGWIDNVEVCFIDEPNIADLKTKNGCIALANLFKSLNPDLCLRVTKMPPLNENDGFFKAFDHFEVHGNHYKAASESKLNIFKRNGKKLSIYVNAIEHVQFGGMRVRTYPWIQWIEGVDGSLSWCRVANWPVNPWEQFNGTFFGIHGEMMLMYPPYGPYETGPINSIRWELLREGLEDWEYLHMFEKLGGRNNPKLMERIKHIITRVPNVPPLQQFFGTTSPYDEPYEKDQGILRELRKDIGNFISRENEADKQINFPVISLPELLHNGISLELKLEGETAPYEEQHWYIRYPGTNEIEIESPYHVKLSSGDIRLRCKLTHDGGKSTTITKYLMCNENN